KDRKQRSQYRRSGRVYCTPECRDAWVKRDRSQRMSATNRKYASERMRKKNAMHDPASVQKMKDTLAKMGHRPAFRGGNGKPVPMPQQRLANHLGWPTEVVIAPGDRERPYHYRVDIAHPTMKVAVEVDGGSHYSRERQASTRSPFCKSSIGLPPTV